MGNIGYTKEGAAEAVGVEPRVIELAIHDRKLLVKRIEGTPVILHRDLKKWAYAMPDWFAKVIEPTE